MELSRCRMKKILYFKREIPKSGKQKVFLSFLRFFKKFLSKFLDDC